MAGTSTVINFGAEVIHMQVTKGNTITFLGALKQEGVRIPLTDFQWFLKVTHPRSLDVKADLSIGDGIELEPGSSDELVRFTILDSVTETWDCITYNFKIEFITPAPSSYRRTAGKGKIIVADPQSQS